MIFVTKTKQERKYQVPEMPIFEDRRSKITWLRNQRMLSSIYNIKSVSVQVKDIKHMIYSKNFQLVYFHTKFYSNNNASYDDSDYITITKSSSLNRTLIYTLINTDWLLNIEDVNNKSIEELQQECIKLQNKIYGLKKTKKRMPNSYDIDYEIKLFEYKLSCLSEIILNRLNKESD